MIFLPNLKPSSKVSSTGLKPVIVNETFAQISYDFDTRGLTKPAMPLEQVSHNVDGCKREH